MVTLQLTEATVEALVALAYAAWAEAYDEHKRAREEKNDGSPDWDDFHAIRLEGSKTKLAAAKTVSDEIMKYSILA